MFKYSIWTRWFCKVDCIMFNLRFSSLSSSSSFRYLPSSRNTPWNQNPTLQKTVAKNLRMWEFILFGSMSHYQIFITYLLFFIVFNGKNICSATCCHRLNFDSKSFKFNLLLCECYLVLRFSSSLINRQKMKQGFPTSAFLSRLRGRIPKKKNDVTGCLS